jgi:protein phosphatase
MTLDLAGRTHVGLKRSENQDEVFAQVLSPGERPFACLAVADGMGGHEKGREASQVAIKTIRDRLTRFLRSEGVHPNEEWCLTLEKEAHKSVGALSSGKEVAGTTLTLALLFGAECVIGHVGDSRAYCFRKGKLDQITEDQTWEEYARKNEIENTYGKALRQAVGVGGAIVPETYRLELLPDDWLILCSDGLYKMADITQVESELSRSQGASDACERLVTLALAGGGKDNVAICVARFGEPPAIKKKFDSVLALAIVAALIIALLLFFALTGKI